MSKNHLENWEKSITRKCTKYTGAKRVSRGIYLTFFALFINFLRPEKCIHIFNKIPAIWTREICFFNPLK